MCPPITLEKKPEIPTMALFDYWIGVLLAVACGVVNNVGMVLQKKVVNDLPAKAREERFKRSLARNPLWLVGLVLQMVVGSAFFMLAQVYIGPALIPGLMAAGLVVLAIGSVRIVGERIRAPEAIGIGLMILGIVLLGLSGLVIATESYNALDTAFLTRVTLFTLTLLVIAVGCAVGQRKSVAYRGTLLAILSGCMFALSNFWIFPLMATIVHVLGFTFILVELAIFVLAAVILVLTNVFGISTIQDSFKVGEASLMVPIQQIPVQVAPAFVYLAVFLLAPPAGYYSLMLLGVGIGLIIVSSFLLAKRQAQIQAIK
jgi:multidrug transporter EmrE-like cation transporter